MKNTEISQLQLEYIGNLTDWVRTMFSFCQNLNTLISAFNYHFKTYQEDFDKKMDIEEIKNGAIDCSMGALVVGIWWALHKDTNPEFLIDLKEAGYVKKFQRHALVALPLIKLASQSSLQTELYKPKEQRSLEVVDYVYSEDVAKAHKNGLGIAPDKRIPVAFNHISGVKNFARNRFEVFKYRP